MLVRLIPLELNLDVGSIMLRSPGPLRERSITTHLYANSLKGVSFMKLHLDFVGISQKSADFLAQRSLEAWSKMRSGLNRPMKADETWMAGKRKNQRNARRDRLLSSCLLHIR